MALTQMFKFITYAPENVYNAKVMMMMIQTDYGTIEKRQRKTAYISTGVSFHSSYNTWHTHLLPADGTRFEIASGKDYSS
jgi:hypothetical protein